MIGIGSALMLFGIGFWALRKRGKDLLQNRWFLKAAVVAGPLAILAMELGWITTEVGRQPWIVQDVMRTADAVTTRPGIVWHLIGTIVVYALLGVACTWLLLRLARKPQGTVEP